MYDIWILYYENKNFLGFVFSIVIVIRTDSSNVMQCQRSIIVQFNGITMVLTIDPSLSPSQTKAMAFLARSFLRRPLTMRMLFLIQHILWQLLTNVCNVFVMQRRTRLCGDPCHRRWPHPTLQLRGEQLVTQPHSAVTSECTTSTHPHVMCRNEWLWLCDCVMRCYVTCNDRISNSKDEGWGIFVFGPALIVFGALCLHANTNWAQFVHG